MNCEWNWDPEMNNEWEMSGDEGEGEEGPNPYQEALENGADPYDVYQ